MVDLEFDFQSENDNNIVISCKAAFPVMWSEIVFHNQNAKVILLFTQNYFLNNFIVYAQINITDPQG